MHRNNKTTVYTYNANGRIGTLTAVNATTGNQVTQWIYGTSTVDSEVVSNELLHAKIYPDSSGGSDQVVYGYNRLGHHPLSLSLPPLGRNQQPRIIHHL
jgi:hypothetical protein